MTDTLLDSTMRRDAQLQRFGTYLKSEYITPAYQKLARDIPKLLVNFDDLNKFEQKRLIKEINELMGNQLNDMFQSITDELHSMSADEGEFIFDLYDDFAELNFTALESAAVIKAADTSVLSLEKGKGRTIGLWSELIADNIAGATKEVDNIVRDGFRGGKTLNDMVQQIRGTYNRGTKKYMGGILDTTTNRAEALVRTGVSHYSNRARDEFFNDNYELLPESVFFATLDNRTTTTCFVPETEVCGLNDVKDIIRSDYTGYAVTIRTASGKELTGTPNHPILTSDGFVPMGELDPSKHIVYAPLIDGFKVFGRNNVSMPTKIGELFDSINHPSVFNVLTKSSTTADFYGDGMGGDSKVNIVDAYGHLSYDIVPSALKHGLDSEFAFVSDDSFLSSFGFIDEVLPARLPVVKTSQVASGLLKVGVNEVFRPADTLEYFTGSRTVVEHFNNESAITFNFGIPLTSFEAFGENSDSLEQFSDSGSAGVIFFAELGGAHPIPVLMDNIVMVERKFIDSHVYTLSSESTIYIAGGLIVKNCLSLHLTVWNNKDPKKPILPLHYGERSVYVGKGPSIDPLSGDRPVVSGRKGAGELFDEKQSRTNKKVKYKGRASNDVFKVEQVSAKVTSQQFMERQPRFFIESTLGKTRAKLFLDGGLDIKKFTDLTGRPLSLKELRETAAGEKAFRKSGLG